jgi:hypothetical protein
LVSAFRDGGSPFSEQIVTALYYCHTSYFCGGDKEVWVLKISFFSPKAKVILEYSFRSPKNFGAPHWNIAGAVVNILFCVNVYYIPFFSQTVLEGCADA